MEVKFILSFRLIWMNNLYVIWGKNHSYFHYILQLAYFLSSNLICNKLNLFLEFLYITKENYFFSLKKKTNHESHLKFSLSKRNHFSRKSHVHASILSNYLLYFNENKTKQGAKMRAQKKRAKSIKDYKI